MTTTTTPEGAGEFPLSDEQLSAIAYKGYDDYWSEGCAGKQSEAWAASAKAVITALRAQAPSSEQSADQAAAQEGPVKWCGHCRKDDHNDAECWSTRIGMHDASPQPVAMPTAFAWPKEIASLAATPAPAHLEELLGKQVWFDRKDVLRILAHAAPAGEKEQAS